MTFGACLKSVQKPAPPAGRGPEIPLEEEWKETCDDCEQDNRVCVSAAMEVQTTGVTLRLVRLIKLRTAVTEGLPVNEQTETILQPQSLGQRGGLQVDHDDVLLAVGMPVFQAPLLRPE